MGVKPLSKDELKLGHLLEPGARVLQAPPLWYYVLCEATARCGGSHLGPVGGRIVAEVLGRTLGGRSELLPALAPGLDARRCPEQGTPTSRWPTSCGSRCATTARWLIPYSGGCGVPRGDIARAPKVGVAIATTTTEEAACRQPRHPAHRTLCALAGLLPQRYGPGRPPRITDAALIALAVAQMFW